MSDINYLVSAQWLSQQLNNPQVAIADCRFLLANPQAGYQQYCQNHIRGAYYLDLDQDLSSPITKHGGRHPLPNSEKLAAKLASMGINFGETLVVAYDDSRFAFSSRLWWLLRYFGHNKVALLDGGYQGWQGKGYPLTQTMPASKSGKLVPQVQKDWIVNIETLKIRKNLPEVVLIDSRDSDRYRGEIEPIDPIAGHIPSAVNSPWKDVSDSQGYLHPLHIQQQLWTNYQQKEEVIVYCGSGVTACVNFLSLELAGIKNVKLYPGGWSDWCSYLT